MNNNNSEDIDKLFSKGNECKDQDDKSIEYYCNVIELVSNNA